jgi:hypothetical protein
MSMARPSAKDASGWHEMELWAIGVFIVLLQWPFVLRNQCDMRQQIGLVASSSRVTLPNIHSPRRLCP